MIVIAVFIWSSRKLETSWGKSLMIMINLSPSGLSRVRKTQWGCGGVLINQWFVLTAAACQVVDNIPIVFKHTNLKRKGNLNLIFQGKGRHRITKVRLGEHTVAGQCWSLLVKKVKIFSPRSPVNSRGKFTRRAGIHHCRGCSFCS